MQVKQSAARQSWHAPDAAPTRGLYSIAHKTCRYEDDGSWTAVRSRNADLFVFAWHPRIDASADHRDPDQWSFLVLREETLPPTQSLSLATLRTLAPETEFVALAATVGALVATPPSPRT